MKNIVVTGCTRGIGYAICRLFAGQGYEVAGCARDASALANMQEDFETSWPGRRFHFSACNMEHPAAIRAFGDSVAATFGSIDVLVNNAGTFVPGQIQNEAEGVLEKLLAVNVSSAYHMTRALLPEMKQAKKGHIFNMCSVASIRPYENGGSYCISKFALLGFSKQLREEMKPHGIRVTALLPGATLTDSWQGSGFPEDRFIKAGDIARTIWDIYHLSSHTDVEEILIRPQLGDI